MQTLRMFQAPPNSVLPEPRRGTRAAHRTRGEGELPASRGLTWASGLPPLSEQVGILPPILQTRKRNLQGFPSQGLRESFEGQEAANLTN